VGQGQSYLEASLSVAPTRPVHVELAQLFDHLERPADADRTTAPARCSASPDLNPVPRDQEFRVELFFRAARRGASHSAISPQAAATSGWIRCGRRLQANSVPRSYTRLNST